MEILKISLSRFTNFVFPLLEWLYVLVITKLLVRMHKIHVKKDPSKPESSSLLCEIVCMTPDKGLVLLKKQTDWPIDKLSCKNVFELILKLFQFFTLKDLVEMYKINKGRKE